MSDLKGVGVRLLVAWLWRRGGGRIWLQGRGKGREGKGREGKGREREERGGTKGFRISILRPLFRGLGGQ